MLARLDRIFINTNFNSAFPDTTLSSLPSTTSDQTPLLTTISTSLPQQSTFRFETLGS